MVFEFTDGTVIPPVKSKGDVSIVPNTANVSDKGGSVSFKFQSPIQKKKETLEVKKLEKDLAGAGIMTNVDNVSAVVDASADVLNDAGVFSPVGLPMTSIKKRFNIGDSKAIDRAISLGNDYAYQLQYMAAAGIAKQEGRGLSDADLRIAGAVAPKLDGTEPYSVVKDKTLMLKKIAKGEITPAQISTYIKTGTINQSKSSGGMTTDDLPEGWTLRKK